MSEGEIKDILRRTMFSKDGIPKCVICGKEMEMAYDSKLKRKTKYGWKTTCKHGKNLRLAIL